MAAERVEDTKEATRQRKERSIVSQHTLAVLDVDARIAPGCAALAQWIVV